MPVLPPNDTPAGTNQTDPPDPDPVRQVAKARHDLRNPLAHILGFTEMLIEKCGQQGLNFVRSRLQVIERRANDLVRSVNATLTPDQAAIDRADLAALRIELKQGAAHVIQIAETLQARPSVRNDASMAEDLTRIIGAARKLASLAENALDSLLGGPA